jgi:hypothetical protein
MALETPPPVAARMAVVGVEFVKVTVAVKLTVVAPAARVTEAGSVTEELLLDRSKMAPPVAAAALTVTVQRSVVEVVKDVLAHVMPVASGSPIPVKVMAAVVPAELLLSLVMVNLPVTAPAAVGSKLTVNAVVCPGFSVTGKVVPVKVKPVPEMVGALMVTGRFPVELKVSVFVADIVTPSPPNARVVEEVARVRVAAN